MVPTFLTKNGEVYINDLRRYAKGTVLVPSEANTPITINPSTSSPPIVVEGPQDAATEIFSLMATYGDEDAIDNNFLKVKIHDIAYRRDLMNRPVLANHVFGNGQRPGRLHESLVLEGQQTLTFEFSVNNPETSPAPAAIDFSFALEARTFQGYGVAHPHVKTWLAEQRERKAYLAPFWFTTDSDIPTLVAGGSTEAFLTNTSDRFLLLCDIMADAYSKSGQSSEGDTGLFTFELRDAKTGRMLMNQPVCQSCGTGNSQYPFRLDDPILVEPSTQLHLRLKSLISVQDGDTQVINFTFGGVQCMADPATFAQGQMVRPAYAGLPMGRY